MLGTRIADPTGQNHDAYAVQSESGIPGAQKGELMQRTLNPHVPRALWAWVGRQAADRGRTKSSIVAEAIENWLSEPGPVDGEPMVKRCLGLDAELHNRITAAADAAGVSVAEVVRSAIAAAMREGE